MKEYKVSRGYYGGIEDTTIEVPDNMRFICRNGDVGHGIHNGGYNHYLGIVKSDEPNFGEYYIDLFNDIKPYDELPLISSDEITDILSKYYIYETREGDGKLVFEDSKVRIVKTSPDKLIYAHKILRVEGPFAVTMCTVTLGSIFNKDADNRLFSIEFGVDKELNNYTTNYLTCVKTTIQVTEDSTKFLQALNKVIEKCGIKKTFMNDYIEFLADVYEQEDEFWKEYFNDLESDYWISYLKAFE